MDDIPTMWEELETLKLKVDLILINIQGLELVLNKLMYPTKNINEIQEEINNKYNI